MKATNWNCIVLAVALTAASAVAMAQTTYAEQRRSEDQGSGKGHEQHEGKKHQLDEKEKAQQDKAEPEQKKVQQHQKHQRQEHEAQVRQHQEQERQDRREQVHSTRSINGKTRAQGAATGGTARGAAQRFPSSGSST
jgi:hypothetical protein